jgi:hypothetical protein
MKLPLAPISVFLLFIPMIAFGQTSGVEVVILDEHQESISSFFPFGEDYRGSASITSADLGNDTVPEIIIGSGPGLEPLIKIFRQDGSLISEFLAYHETYKNGTDVAVCDLNNDGEIEIVTGTMVGGGPHVRIFNTDGHLLCGGGFFAYAGDFRGGVNVACGDVNNDGLDDIVTGAGLTGGPHVKIFDPMGNLQHEIFAGSASENTGVDVAVADLNGDGDSEIITGRMGSGDPTVIAFDFKNNHLTFVLALSAFNEYQNGISISSADVDGDGMDEIGVTTTNHSVGELKYFEMTGAISHHSNPFDSQQEKGLVTTGVQNGGSDHVLAMSTSARSSDQIGKYIAVDISDQTLYAYENGVPVNSFLVSTGTYSHPTPLGTTDVTDKLLWHDYVWTYGPDNPNNYSLPDVKYNLRFRPHYYIHSAYWHNNFGNRMSHGCVNVHETNAEWIYNWADVGTIVDIIE